MSRKNVLTQGARNNALALYRAGRLEEARPLLEQVCARDRRDAEAWSTLGLTCAAQGEYGAAEARFRHLTGLRPKDARAHYNLGRSLELQGRLDEAETAYRRALRHSGDGLVEAFNNLGNVYREQDRDEEALANYLRALEIEPRHQHALNNSGVVLERLHRHEEALARYDAALDIDPQYIQAHWNRALLLLTLGRFAEGWPEFEWGFAVGERACAYAPYPLWDGGPLAGRTLLVQAEQGVGDVVMFGSCLADVPRDAAGVVLECDPRLAPLFRRSFPGMTVVGRDKDDPRAWLSGLPHVDVKVAIGSLPRWYRSAPGQFPVHDGYLAADPDAVARWRAVLARSGAGVKVGIAWRGGGKADAKRRRSLSLRALAPLLRRPGVDFVNLQYDARPEEIALAERETGVRIHGWQEADPMADLDAHAALVTALDLVISADNSTVHLAGALGKPTWVMLPRVPDWRWMLRREDSPWYPSVRLFRQSSPGDWRPVLERIAAELDLRPR